MINITDMCQVTSINIYDDSNINSDGELIEHSYTEINVYGDYDFNKLIFDNRNTNFILDGEELTLIEINGRGALKFRVIGKSK